MNCLSQFFLMKRSTVILMCSVLFGIASCSFLSKADANPERNKLLIDLISFVLDREHFDARKINDEFSKEVYHSFIEALDPQKRYFYQSDIDDLSVYINDIDNQINDKELTFFDLAYSILKVRIDEAQNLYKELLDEPFDFNEEDTINVDYDNLEYASTKQELSERWMKRLKFSTLSTYYDKIEEQKIALENNPETEEKPLEELEAEAREITESSINEYFDFTNDLEAKDWFSVYVNSIVVAFDPHTYYFAPKDKDRFDISMSGKLEGIGARLSKKNDNIKIVEVISGGPAWRGEEVEVGDIILKVRQQDEKEAVSIVGMRLDDAVSLIKGPKGTKVILTLRRVSGAIEDIVITRDVVELEETYAKSSLVKKDKHLYGLINLPKFYFNTQDYNQRNAASDVEKEIEYLKEKNIEGLVIDLRNNGGGSLQTVVDIAGLFIKKGPVVQVKRRNGSTQVLNDEDPSLLWDGPLVIMVNELSASASEILAAAMQDYKRAIVIGSKQTYGKGTVQNIIDLNRLYRNSSIGDLGAIKITTQKFYRVNGGSTQLEGVKSDIIVPDQYSYIDIGEKDQDNPLPYDKIAPADYSQWTITNYQEIINRSRLRMKKNSQLQLIDENAKWISERRNTNQFSINFNNYKDKIDHNEEKVTYFEKIKDYRSDISFKSLPYEMALIENDTVLGTKRDRWHENLTTDVYIEEAVNVLQDIELETAKSRR